MSTKNLVIICLSAMLVLLMLRKGIYQVAPWKVVPLTVIISAMGLVGTFIMYYIENGSWNGRSFYGAVLFFPLLLLPAALCFRVQLTALLSYATPPGMILLAFYKYNCLTDNCCGGKVLWFEEGVPIYFPSQIAEMANAVAIAVLLMALERKDKWKDKIYPLCLVVYGITRYILNMFRWEQSDFLFGLPVGNIWSIVSVVIGIFWLVVKALMDCRRVNQIVE